MNNNNDIREELEGLSPFLSKQKNRPEGFEIPKDYFKSLPNMVMDKVKEKPVIYQEPSSNWVDEIITMLQGLFQPRYAVAIASVAILLVAGIYFTADSENPAPLTALLSEVPDEALDNYISENIDDFDVALFEEHIDDSENMSPTLNLDGDDELLEELLDDLSVEDLEDLL